MLHVSSANIILEKQQISQLESFSSVHPDNLCFMNIYHQHIYLQGRNLFIFSKTWNYSMTSD